MSSKKTKASLGLIPWDFKVGDMVQFTSKGRAADHFVAHEAIGLITDFMEDKHGMGYYEVQFPNDRTWADSFELRLVSE